MIKNNKSKKTLFKLFVVGQTPNSKRGVENLTQILKNKFKEKYQLQIIDIMKDPYLAMANNIVATPTLVREINNERLMLVGDFNDHDKVLSMLDI